MVLPVLQTSPGFSFLGFCGPVKALTIKPTTMTVIHPQAEYHMYERLYKSSGLSISFPLFINELIF